MSWYKTGYDNLDNEDVKESENRRKGGLRRWWMKKGETRRILFVDGEDPMMYWEHQLKIDGSWQNWEVCLKKNGIDPDCPVCEEEKKFAYYAALYTLIDIDGWEDKKGNKHTCERKLLAAKTKLSKKLRRQHEKRGGLAGCIYDLTRGDDEQSLSTGDDLDPALCVLFPAQLWKDQGGSIPCRDRNKK